MRTLEHESIALSPGGRADVSHDRDPESKALRRECRLAEDRLHGLRWALERASRGEYRGSVHLLGKEHERLLTTLRTLRRRQDALMEPPEPAA